MNRTTSRHLASSIATDRWAAADRSRSVRGQDDDASKEGHGSLTTLRAWASRVQHGVSAGPHRTAGNTALD
jgi:hypothetical protein